MCKKLTQKINDFLNQNCDLWDVADETMLHSNSYDELKNAITHVEALDSDESMIAALLLWTIKDSPFQEIENSLNPFFNLLLSIVPSRSDFFQEKIKWHYTNDNELIFEKGDFVFLINNKEKDTVLQLPDTFVNVPLFCHNCSEEIKPTTCILVPSKTFYIISL